MNLIETITLKKEYGTCVLSSLSSSDIGSYLKKARNLKSKLNDDTFIFYEYLKQNKYSRKELFQKYKKFNKIISETLSSIDSEYRILLDSIPFSHLLKSKTYNNDYKSQLEISKDRLYSSLFDAVFELNSLDLFKQDLFLIVDKYIRTATSLLRIYKEYNSLHSKDIRFEYLDKVKGLNLKRSSRLIVDIAESFIKHKIESLANIKLLELCESLKNTIYIKDVNKISYNEYIKESNFLAQIWEKLVFKSEYTDYMTNNIILFGKMEDKYSNIKKRETLIRSKFIKFVRKLESINKGAIENRERISSFGNIDIASLLSGKINYPMYLIKNIKGQEFWSGNHMVPVELLSQNLKNKVISQKVSGKYSPFNLIENWQAYIKNGDNSLNPELYLFTLVPISSFINYKLKSKHHRLEIMSYQGIDIYFDFYIYKLVRNYD